MTRSPVSDLLASVYRRLADFPRAAARVPCSYSFHGTLSCTPSPLGSPPLVLSHKNAPQSPKTSFDAILYPLYLRTLVVPESPVLCPPLFRLVRHRGLPRVDPPASAHRFHHRARIPRHHTTPGHRPIYCTVIYCSTAVALQYPIAIPSLNQHVR